MKKRQTKTVPAKNDLQHVPDGGCIALSEEDLFAVPGGNMVSSGGESHSSYTFTDNNSSTSSESTQPVQESIPNPFKVPQGSSGF